MYAYTGKILRFAQDDRFTVHVILSEAKDLPGFVV